MCHFCLMNFRFQYDPTYHLERYWHNKSTEHRGIIATASQSIKPALRFHPWYPHNPEKEKAVKRSKRIKAAHLESTAVWDMTYRNGWISSMFFIFRNPLSRKLWHFKQHPMVHKTYGLRVGRKKWDLNSLLFKDSNLVAIKGGKAISAIHQTTDIGLQNKMKSRHLGEKQNREASNRR